MVAGVVSAALVASSLQVTTASAVEYEDVFDVLDLGRPELSAVASEVAQNDLVGAAEALQTHFAARTTPEWTPIVPGSVSSLVTSTADELADGYFEFRGGLSRDFSSGIDWADTWSDDPAVPLGQPHYWMYDFTFYATLTGAYLALPSTDPKRAVYTAAWERTAVDFMDAHENVVSPYNRLGTAKRLTQWLGAYSVFKDSPTADPQVLSRYVAQIHAMADDLCRNLERHNGNNWYASIARAVYMTAVYFPEFISSTTWERRVIGAMDRVVALQMKGDAVQFEPALNYQAYNLDLLVQIERFGRLNGRSPLAAHLQVMERQAEVIMAATMPDFTVPLIGDTPSSTLSLTAYAELFDRDDMRWVASEGATGTMPALGSDLAPHSYAFMRTGWDSEDAYLAVANQDTNYGASHRHPDDLSVVAYAHGRPLLIDPGVVDYNDTPSANWLRRTTAAHNTVEVNGQAQPGPAAGDRVRRAEAWASNAGFDFYAGMHDDYAPITHDRNVFFAKEAGLWILSDRLQGSSSTNAYRQLWHPPGDAPIDVTAAGTVNAGFGSVPGISVIPVDAVPTTVHDDGYIADGLGGLESDAEYFSFDQSVAGPAAFDTVLLPGAAGSAPDADVTRTSLGVPVDTATAFDVELADSSLAFYQSFESTPQARTVGAHTTDARVLAITSDGLGDVTTIQLVGGTGVSDSAGDLVRSAGPLGDVSVRLGSTLRIETGGFRDEELRVRDLDAVAVEVNGIAVPLVRDGDYVVIAEQSRTTGDAVFEPVFDEAAGVVDVSVEGLAGDFQPAAGTWRPVETSPGVWAVSQTTATAVEAALLRRVSASESSVRVSADLESTGPTFGVGAYVRYVDPSNYYLARVYRTGGVLSAQVVKVANGTAAIIGDAPITLSVTDPIELDVVVVGGAIELRVNGALGVRVHDATHADGGVGLYAHRTQATFSELEIGQGSRVSSDFSAGTSGWTATSGTWAAAQRAGEWGLHQQSTSARDTGISAGAESSDQSISSRFVLQSASASMAFGLQVRVADAANRVLARVYRTGGVLSAQIVGIVGGTPSVLASEPITLDLSQPVELEAIATDSGVALFVDGALAVSAASASPSSGATGLYTDRATGAFEQVAQAALASATGVDFEPVSGVGWQSVAGNWLAGEALNDLNQWDGTAADQVAIFDQVGPNVELTTSIMLHSGQSSMGVGHVLRYQDPSTYYLARLYRTGGAYSAQLIRMLGGTATVLGTAPVSSVTYPLELTSRASGDLLEVSINGTPVVRARDAALASGVVGLHTHRASAGFADLALTELVAADDWRVGHGLVAVSGAQMEASSPDGQSSFATSTGIGWQDVAVAAQMSHGGLAVGESAGSWLRSTGSHTGYGFVIERTSSGTVAKIVRKTAGSRGTQAATVLAEAPVVVDFSGSVQLGASAVGDVLTFTLDGVEVLSTRDGILATGGVGLSAKTSAPVSWSEFVASAVAVGS
ncbi:alginate lyase family protein [Agromyces silvae]|uniref:alginate lyase family protein n=1 Tax=Agromyces silvae TaxID=3388266 RepID=UPI00280AA67F|nr:alginate lyase family protein [Agromyces protaetiae]